MLSVSIGLGSCLVVCVILVVFMVLVWVEWVICECWIVRLIVWFRDRGVVMVLMVGSKVVVRVIVCRMCVDIESFEDE